jgi:hypothetical protein
MLRTFQGIFNEFFKKERLFADPLLKKEGSGDLKK